MSASLVGSEMCIRDSAWSSHLRKGNGQGPAVSPLRQGRGVLGPALRHACLLYTSDAADDM
eukprot:11077735-Alexandrium_andersonii.AAC.1